MPGHTTDNCKTLKNAIQDLIDSGKIDDPERQPNVKTNPLPKYQDIPRTNYPTTPQPSSKPDIIPFGSHTSQASDGTPTSQIPPTLWNPTSDHRKTRGKSEGEPWKAILSE